MFVTIRIISEEEEMEMIRRFEPVALLLVVLGALNWGWSASSTPT